MKYFIIAGESSGDLHGSDLIREILKNDKAAEIECWGGDRMEKAGARLLKHYRDHAIMGFWEVIVNLRLIRRRFRECREQVKRFAPDVVILIDYPGFNLRMAEYLKSEGIRVYYYISPKVWAWKESRVKKIKRTIDRLYIIFPFEVDFFEKHGIKAIYYGNPLVDSVKDELEKSLEPALFKSENKLNDKPVIALLPGSRIQEVKMILPDMVNLYDSYSDYQFIVAGVKSVPGQIYKDIIGSRDIKIVYDQTFSLLRSSLLAIVTSGTATLETALAGIPQIVCYRTSPVTYFIGRLLVKVRFISLVNLILDRKAVLELVQNQLNTKALLSEVNNLLPGGWKRDIQLRNYSQLGRMLGNGGAASKIASDICSTLHMINNVN